MVKQFGFEVRLLFTNIGFKACKNLFEHFGLKAWLFFKHIRQEACLSSKISILKQDYCSHLLDLKQKFWSSILDFCPNIVDLKQEFVQKFWTWSKTFGKTFWIPSKTLIQITTVSNCFCFNSDEIQCTNCQFKIEFSFLYLPWPTRFRDHTCDLISKLMCSYFPQESIVWHFTR